MSKMLSSWKEIAHFFGKGVRTVQRWEKTLDLPIHRPPGAPSNVVLARTSDLEEWMHRGPAARALEESAEHTHDAVNLDGLEIEIAKLAEVAGIHSGLSGTTAEERLAALCETVRQARTKFAARASTERAA